MKSNKLNFENLHQSYLKCLTLCGFSSVFSLFSLLISIFIFFYRLNNRKIKIKNEKHEEGEEERNDNYLRREMTFSYILSLAFKDKTETNDVASKLQISTFFFQFQFCYTAFKRNHCILKVNWILYVVSLMNLSSSFLSPFY